MCVNASFVVRVNTESVQQCDGCRWKLAAEWILRSSQHRPQFQDSAGKPPYCTGREMTGSTGVRRAPGGMETCCWCVVRMETNVAGLPRRWKNPGGIPAGMKTQCSYRCISSGKKKSVNNFPEAVCMTMKSCASFNSRELSAIHIH